MKVLQTVKFYSPSNGGMESVVKNITEGITSISKKYKFTVYCNSHFPLFKKKSNIINGIRSLTEFTPFLLRSQPLNIRYSSLRGLLNDTDIVHHHYPFPNMELALLRNKDILVTKKLVITWHANIKNSRWSWIGKYYDPIIEQLLIIAETVVVTSPQLLDNSAILQRYKDKVKVIALSYNPKFFNPLAFSKELRCGKKELLFVGKLRKYKGINYLIDAIVHLDVNLTIIGDGEEESALKLQVEKQGLGVKVQFLKNIDDDSLAFYYRNSDLFILPSINEAEAFGVVQLEALANGLPVINTNLKSGVPFVSLHQQTGLTVEPKSTIEITKAIEKIISAPSLYKEYSLKSLERAKLFSRDSMSSSYIDIYNYAKH